jgi:outer membrane protein assembly factor BamA
MVRGFLRLAAIILFGLGSSLCADVREYTITLDSGTQLATDSIVCVPDEVIVKNFECSTNNGIDSKEIAYLLGIGENKPINAEQFCIGLERLKQKNVFSSLSTVWDTREDGLYLTVKVDAFWVIKSIKVQGISLGKQSIVHLYQLQVGERFSKEKHEFSLQEIVKDLHNKGYCDATVDAFFEYEIATKSIHLSLVVTKGPLYFIDDVHVTIQSTLDKQWSVNLSDFLYKKTLRYLLYKPYSESLIHKKIAAVQNLLVAEGFVYAKVSSTCAVDKLKKNATILFAITFDCPKKINFLGNVFFPRTLLIENIRQCAHSIGVVPSVILAEEMSDLYRAKGFFTSAIETTEDIQNYYFIINEGPRKKIDDIIVRGAFFVAPKYLVNRFFKHILHTHSDEKKLKTSMQACLNWYRSEGFWDAQFIKKEYVAKKNNGLIIEFVLDEGARRLFKNVTVEGFPEYRKELLAPTLHHSKKSMPLSESMLARQKEMLEKECKKYGYTTSSIRYELIDEDGAYQVLWHVKTGHKMKFGKTIIKGTAIDHAKILNFLPYKEGDIWSKERLNEVYNGFRNLGIYKSIGVQQHFIRDHQDLSDVILTLEEDDPFEVKLRLGFQQISKNFALKKGSSYKVGGGFIWKNPTSRLDSLTLDTSLTRFERRAFIAYKQPLLFTVPLETVVKMYSNAYMNPVSAGSRKILYEALQNGLLFGLTSKNEWIEAGISSGFEWMKIKDISLGLSNALNFVPQLIDERVPYWFCEPTLYINYLDDVLNPSRGYFLFASMKSMIPFDLRASASLKFLVENGFYTSWGSAVGAARIRFGHIFLQDFSSIMPPERFYLGGANSLRGYQPDRCPPLGSFVDEDGYTQWVSQGGKSMLNANFELRFPLPLQNLRGAFFQDFGILAPDLQSVFHTLTPLAATGFGIRYITPLGPLRFDIGWKWKKQYEQDTSYAWFLTFGYAF